MYTHLGGHYPQRRNSVDDRGAKGAANSAHAGYGPGNYVFVYTYINLICRGSILSAAA